MEATKNSKSYIPGIIMSAIAFFGSFLVIQHRLFFAIPLLVSCIFGILYFINTEKTIFALAVHGSVILAGAGLNIQNFISSFSDTDDLILDIFFQFILFLLYYFIPEILHITGIILKKKWLSVIIIVMECLFIIFVFFSYIVSLVVVQPIRINSVISDFALILVKINLLIILYKSSLSKYIKTAQKKKTKKEKEMQFIPMAASLESLKSLYENGKISEEEYALRKKQILDIF